MQCYSHVHSSQWIYDVHDHQQKQSFIKKSHPSHSILKIIFFIEHVYYNYNNHLLIIIISRIIALYSQKHSILLTKATTTKYHTTSSSSYHTCIWMRYTCIVFCTIKKVIFSSLPFCSPSIFLCILHVNLLCTIYTAEHNILKKCAIKEAMMLNV